MPTKAGLLRPPRIAIIDKSLCKPNKCKKECQSICPPQKGGKIVIDIEDVAMGFANETTKLARVSETECIGCNLCVSRCPFKAIKIINLPEGVESEIIHSYDKNSFKLYKLPMMQKNCVMALIGENGIGKSTIIDILSKRIMPNFGNNETQQTNTKNIISHFRGSTMLNYMNDLYNNRLSISLKP
jgi:ATP-binding cassette subfamily E protein 1